LSWSNLGVPGITIEFTYFNTQKTNITEIQDMIINLRYQDLMS